MSAVTSALGGVRGRRAFTLIELLVVILIVAILISVALPSFLGQTYKARDSVAQQSLAVAYTDVKAIWTSAGQSQYPSANALVAQLLAAEPSYAFVQDPSSTAVDAAPVGTIGVNVSQQNPADNTVTLCEKSGSGVVFCLRADTEAQLTQDAAFAPALRTQAFGLAVANADSTGLTQEIQADGTTESGAYCVLNAETPSSDGGMPGSASGCAPSGYPGWANALTNGANGGAAVAAPQNTSAPSISGTSEVGATVTASPGSWSPSSPAPSLAYQWYDCSSSTFSNCQIISGATASSYTVTAQDAGQYVAVSVIDTNSAGSATADAVSSTKAITVATAYQQAVLSSGAAGYWPAMTGSPTPNAVSGGAAINSGTLNGGSVSYSPTGPMNDSAVTFPVGVQANIGLGDAPISGTAGASWTTEVWFDWSGQFDSSGEAALASSAFDAVGLYKTSPTTVCLGFINGGSYANCLGQSFSISSLTGGWHDLVAQFYNGMQSPSDTALWLDGKALTETNLVGAQVAESFGSGDAGLQIRFGHTRAPGSVTWDIDQGGFFGQLADPAIYNEAAPAGMAAAHYAAAGY